MTYIDDANPSNHLIIGVVQAAILPKTGTVRGTTIVTNAQYAYGAINLTSSMNLTTTEPMVTLTVGLTERINNVFYQVIYLLFIPGSHYIQVNLTCTNSGATDVFVQIPIPAALLLINESITTSQGIFDNITVNSFTVFVGTMNPGDTVIITYNASFITSYNPPPALSSIIYTWDTKDCSGN